MSAGRPSHLIITRRFGCATAELYETSSNNRAPTSNHRLAGLCHKSLVDTAVPPVAAAMPPDAAAMPPDAAAMPPDAAAMPPDVRRGFASPGAREWIIGLRPWFGLCPILIRPKAIRGA